MTEERPVDAAATTGEASPEAVEAFLWRNPGFLADRADLFLAMTPPERYRGDGVVDLRQHQVRGLREELDVLRACAREFVEVSRVNLEIQARAHAAVLAVLGAPGLGQAAQVIREQLPGLLDVAAARLVFEREPRHPAVAALGLGMLEADTVARLVPEPGPVALFSRHRDEFRVFGADSGRIRSAAYARVRPAPGGPVALFALGGAEPLDFHPGQATDLLGFLARVLERCVHAWLERRT